MQRAPTFRTQNGHHFAGPDFQRDVLEYKARLDGAEQPLKAGRRFHLARVEYVVQLQGIVSADHFRRFHRN